MNFIFHFLPAVSTGIMLVTIWVYLLVVRQQAKYKTLRSMFERLEREKNINLHNQSAQLKTFMDMNVQMVNGPLAKILTLANVPEQHNTFDPDEVHLSLRECANEIDLTLREINSRLQ